MTAPRSSAGARSAADDARIQDLLVKTSRTFALAIPRLPQPTRREVGLAYLLFRIADTLEDASVLWSRRRQIAALADFGSLLLRPAMREAERLSAQWLEEPPTRHAGYLELLAAVPAVLGAVDELSPEARRIVCHHTRRTADGMANFVERSGRDGVLELADVPDLQAYCYVVAGIVGEMLTELFVLDRDRLAPITGYLTERAAAFGEALQLVNILKDSADDREEGRRYLPAGVARAEVFALARTDLEVATEYVRALQRAEAPAGLVTFTGLPVAMARATLDRVERDGPGAKITRLEVYAIERKMKRDLAAARPVV